MSETERSKWERNILETLETECKRLLDRVKSAKEAQKEPYGLHYHTKFSAVKRASLDLNMAGVALRKGYLNAEYYPSTQRAENK
jgi:hypothetical protein